MHRAIPPDLTHAMGSVSEAARQHEAIGDLHFAADNYAGAIESFGAALKEVGPDAPHERARLLQRIAHAQALRGDPGVDVGIVQEPRASPPC